MTKIVFFILPQTHLLDLAGPDQVFLEAKSHGANIEIEYCSFQNSIYTSSNMEINNLKNYKNITFRNNDYLIIPGADIAYLTSKKTCIDFEIKKWFTNASAIGVNLCTICTGAFYMAKLGLLQNRKCTTHWKRTTELQNMYPASKVVEDVLFVEDGKILTSAGVTAGIDLALYIITKLKDDHFSFKVAKELVVYMRRKGDESQQSVFLKYRNHIHSGIHKIQDYIQDNISKKTNLVQLSAYAYMSVRTLTRTFKKETGITISDYASLLRKEYLNRLLLLPNITRKEMAALCGLKSERQVIRILNE